MGEGKGEGVGRYRVEHWVGGGRVALGRVPGPAHHAALVPFASHLRLAGRAAGTLALVDEASGAVVARRGLEVKRRRGAGPR